MKIPFYFRTREQYAEADELIAGVNANISKRVGWTSSWITLWTKYTKNNPMYESIPKRKVTDKKYVAVLHFNKEKIERLKIDLEKLLTRAGYELVPRENNEPKYDGETTEKKIKIDSYDEYCALASELNKGFGFGNWRIHGPKGLQKLIQNVSRAKEQQNRFMAAFIAKYKDGVPIKIVVHKPNADINKYLFKAKLRA